jgi:DNA-binding LacI/PurR family transcriptional regulator
LHWRCGILRRDGWRKTLVRHQLPQGPSCEGEWSARGGYDAALTLLQRGESFTAVVAGNDQMALGVIRALNEKGISVPGEVSIAGYDNMPEAAYFQPSLTTVVNDFEQAGRHCLEYLVRLIRNPQASPRQMVIKPKLVCRESTRRCR